jgi:methylenetetrahydrofolate dehydrogenase (NADP+)/methenyltetrahydrofolate cyclohydrolase
MILLDGKETSKKIRQNLTKEVEQLKSNGIFPKFAVILVGNDSASQIYVRNKNKACQELGILCDEYILEETTTMQELLNLINKLNNDNSVHGILLQSPTPKHIDIGLAFRTISAKKDVDGFNPENVGNLCLGHDGFISCTPLGIIKLLEEYNVSIEGKSAVVIGRSNIVGKPMSLCLLNKNATVTICHSKTKNLAEVVKGADIIVAAIGKANFVTSDMVKDGAIVIDVGINRMEDGKIMGDVDFENVKEKAEYITPVPGGVGPMTIAMLMYNIVKSARGNV